MNNRMSEIEIIKLLSKLSDEWGVDKIPVEFSGRLKNTLGRIHWNGITKKASKFVFSKNHIRNSDRDVVENTVRHEFAHLLDLTLRGTTDHTPEWQKCALAVNADPVPTLHITNPDFYKVVILCKDCGKIHYRGHRRTEKVMYYAMFGTCDVCGSKLKVK